MNNQDFDSLTIGEIVSNDFRVSTIFKNANIDFCCGGNQLIGEACLEKEVNVENLIKEIKNLENEPINPSINFKEWEPGFLCDYIVNTHHKFVKNKMPEIDFYTRKIADVHGDHHPELIKVAELFSKIVAELNQHLKNEEEVLFPAIKEYISNGSDAAKEAIICEITRMKGEHDFAGGSMDEINTLTNSYSLPQDACNTYQVAFKLLEKFEDDLHIHVHLENNILFPAAINMTK